MSEPNELLGKWRYRSSPDDQLREVLVNQAADHEKRTGQPFPPVERDRAVQLWLQRQGWRLQFDPLDVVVNDFMAVHPDVGGDVATRIFVADADQWERVADLGFHAGVPDEFEGLLIMRKRRGGENSHIAAVMANEDTGDVYVEIFERESSCTPRPRLKRLRRGPAASAGENDDTIPFWQPPDQEAGQPC